MTFKFSILAIVTLFVSGCIKFDQASRSGTVDDDYIGHSIDPDYKKYESALVTSNAVIECLITKDFQTLHDRYVDPRFYSTMSVEALSSVFSQNEKKYGPIKNYLKGQWGFVPKKVKNQKALYSVKVVEHEKQLIDYFFVFDGDGNYDRILGFYIKRKDGARVPTRI